VALDMARVVANLQPLVVVACEHGGDAGDAGDAGEAVVTDAAIVQEPGSGCAVPRASRQTRQEQLSYTRLGCQGCQGWAGASASTSIGASAGPKHVP
jgi:hypothetical protein